MKKKIIIIVLALLFVSIAAIFCDYHGIRGNEVTVSVPQGAGATEIIGLLKDNKVVFFKGLFKRYISDDAASLKAGVHTFHTSMGYKDALEELKRNVPLENTVSVTIPEGFEIREIAALLEEAGVVSSTDFLSACKNAFNSFPFLPKNGNVEGYLFPATYDFTLNCEASSVVQTIISTFEKKILTPEILTRIEEMSYDFNDILTLASIIEREAAKDEERAFISSVFYNRLKEGMRLESCATVQYILSERKDVLSVADTKISSPYNTYLNDGLPPSPISSPGEKSVHAALYPADTPFLFFVADGNGGHIFSETYEEHLKWSSLESD